MKWNQELNPSQLKAADQINGQLLILAGAGSGKSKTLTHRIAHMIEEGIPSEQILAITFTKKAAGEMKSRISSLLGDVRQPKACTFHSLGFDIVREFPVECGYRKRVSVCDAADSKTRAKEALAEVVAERGYTEDTWSFESDRQGKEIQPYHKDKDVVNAFLEYISKAKDMCQGPIAASDEVYANMGIIVQRGDFQLAYKKYQDELVADNVLDFDDLIMVPVLLLELNEEIANIYWNKYRYISVDEYQDTNNAQFRLVHRLAEGNGNLCVVGDDYQSIYGFRGADISNILNFKNTYPAANVVILGENYRSTHNIVNGASGVIAYNQKQMHKNLFSMQETGSPIAIANFDTSRSEAEYIIDKIKHEVTFNGKEYKDFAILYRKNVLSRYMEDALMNSGIPYIIYGGLSFYDRKEVKDVVSYLKILSGSDDKKAFARILNVPARGIGAKTVDAILKGQKQQSGETLIERFYQYAQTQKKANVKDFADKLYALYQSVPELTTAGLVSQILDVFDYREYLSAFCKDEDEEAENRILNAEEMIVKCKEFEKEYRIEHPTADVWEVLNEFLANVMLVTDIDRKKDENKSVMLMTMHASKGLEFDTVFMVACEKEIFQVPDKKDDPDIKNILDPEEERRLFYVAMTRAKKQLYITNSDTRFLYGRELGEHPVKFIGEIPNENKKYLRTDRYFRSGYLNRDR